MFRPVVDAEGESIGVTIAFKERLEESPALREVRELLRLAPGQNSFRLIPQVAKQRR